MSAKRTKEWKERTANFWIEMRIGRQYFLQTNSTRGIRFAKQFVVRECAKDVDVDLVFEARFHRCESFKVSWRVLQLKSSGTEQFWPQIRPQGMRDSSLDVFHDDRRLAMRKEFPLLNDRIPFLKLWRWAAFLFGCLCISIRTLIFAILEFRRRFSRRSQRILAFRPRQLFLGRFLRSCFHGVQLESVLIPLNDLNNPNRPSNLGHLDGFHSSFSSSPCFLFVRSDRKKNSKIQNQIFALSFQTDGMGNLVNSRIGVGGESWK